MSARMSEAIVLRTYPFREADLIVSFFTRDQGKMRGVARRARRPGSRFGSGLERLSYVKMYYQQREQRELTTLESCEMIRSPFQMTADYELTVALDYIAEVSEQLLPPAEPFERFFRLIVAVVEHLRETGAAGVWRAATYFSLWAVRLSGFLPSDVASGDDRELAGEMLRTSIGELAPREWTKSTSSRLRRSLIGLIEEHIERRLVTAPMLEAL
jgi:DNA repair protein RecO (recombination protein O)